MTELLIIVMNMPQRVQRAIVCAFTLAILLASGFSVISPAALLLDKRNHVEEMRSELYRLDEVIARAPVVETDVVTPADGAGQFIEGDTLPSIQAKLQERVNAIANVSGAMITSISGTPRTEIDGAAYVGVRADIEGSLPAFHEMVRQLEISDPPLIIRQTTIRSTNVVANGVLSDSLQLAGQVVVFGAIRPEFSSAEGGGG